MSPVISIAGNILDKFTTVAKTQEELLRIFLSKHYMLIHWSNVPEELKQQHHKTPTDNVPQSSKGAIAASLETSDFKHLPKLCSSNLLDYQCTSLRE